MWTVTKYTGIKKQNKKNKNINTVRVPPIIQVIINNTTVVKSTERYTQQHYHAFILISLCFSHVSHVAFGFPSLLSLKPEKQTHTKICDTVSIFPYSSELEPTHFHIEIANSIQLEWTSEWTIQTVKSNYILFYLVHSMGYSIRYR